MPELADDEGDEDEEDDWAEEDEATRPDRRRRRSRAVAAVRRRSSYVARTEIASARRAQYENWVLDQPERDKTVDRLSVTCPEDAGAYEWDNVLSGLYGCLKRGTWEDQ